MSLQNEILVLVACISMSGCSGSGRNQELRGEYEAALSRHDYDGAITCMNEVLKRNPGSSWAYADLGAAYEAKGDLDRAIDNYDRGVRLKPEDADLRYELGSALSRRGDLNQAMSNLDLAIRLNPRHAQAYGNRGTTFQKSGDFQRALSDYNEAIRLAPDFSGAYAARAQVYAAKGEVGKAIEDNSKAIRLDPANADAYNSLGWLLATSPTESLRDGRQAVEAAQKACELSRWTKWQFIDTLAAAWAEAGDFDRAIKYEKQALSMDGVATNRRGEAERRLDLFQQSKPYHQSAAQ